MPPQYVGLKLFHVYGGQENHKPIENRSIVTQYCEQALTENIIRIYRSHHSDAGQWHDFVHIDDCIHVMLWLYDHPDTSGLFNLGSGQSRNLTDLATMVFEHIGREPVIETRSTLDRQPPHYHYCSQADVRSLKAAGYKAPFIALEDGVKSYIDSLKP